MESAMLWNHIYKKHSICDFCVLLLHSSTYIMCRVWTQMFFFFFFLLFVCLLNSRYYTGQIFHRRDSFVVSFKYIRAAVPSDALAFSWIHFLQKVMCIL